MTEKSARETLREAVREFAAKCLRPEGLPDALLLLERELKNCQPARHMQSCSAPSTIENFEACRALSCPQTSARCAGRS